MDYRWSWGGDLALSQLVRSAWLLSLGTFHFLDKSHDDDVDSSISVPPLHGTISGAGERVGQANALYEVRQ